LAAMCAFAAFNLHNADIKTVVHVFTLVPAIIFTFRILSINNDHSTISVTAVAMFWMYYGMGLICDVLFDADESYAIIQFVLAIALGVTAYRGSPIPRDTESEYFRTIRTGSETGVTRRGSPTLSTKLQPTQCSISALSSMTAQRITEDIVEQLSRDVLALQNTLLTMLSDTETAMEIFPIHSPRHGAAGFFNEVADGSVILDYDGLLTRPQRTLRFDHTKDTQFLEITNVTGQNLNWTVKTNAVYEIRALPAQGILGRNEMTTIAVILNSDHVILPGTDHFNDKLAIDYQTSGSFREQHKRQRMESPAKKRYQFDILYNF
uniref:Major sperm protein n=1 Tax=Haemonchus placei TaxID=6290 RepID=A0A0N4WB70_HAEPC